MRPLLAVLWLGVLLGALAGGFALLMLGSAGALIACALILIPFALAKSVSELAKL